MSIEILELLYFYRSDIGLVTKKIIQNHIHKLWQTPPKKLLGIGYTDIFLDHFYDVGADCLSLTPSFTGLYARSGIENYPTALINETELPIAHNSQTNILCLHVLEHTSYQQAFLKATFDILKPEGEVIFIVTNRRGSWARNENTPFGSGRPYTKKQLSNLLQQAGFIITDHFPALFINPNASRFSQYYAESIEILGKMLMPRYSGVHFIRAIKRLYVPPMVTEKKEITNIINTLPDFIPSGKPATSRG